MNPWLPAHLSWSDTMGYVKEIRALEEEIVELQALVRELEHTIRELKAKLNDNTTNNI